MYIRIYFGEKPLFLCDNVDGQLQPYVHHDDAIFIDELDTHTVKTMIHEMQQENIHAGVFYHPDLEALKKAFFKKFTVVIAAGGLVQNEKKEYLLIFRRGKWDLPKGKLDKKESLEECALREIEEETGVKAAQIINPLTISYHTYHEGARFILKESHWFLMKVAGDQNLTPQEEEDITEIKWVNQKEIDQYQTKCFPAIRDVLNLVV
jgi:8-oxo-dGTP pyrophosphatase MutT (NUDIX family)